LRVDEVFGDRQSDEAKNGAHEPDPNYVKLAPCPLIHDRFDSIVERLEKQSTRYKDTSATAIFTGECKQGHFLQKEELLGPPPAE
jgi:hypothetical protein